MIQNFWLLETGYFKLDGGAMFGVVPKSIWNKLNPADTNNMCTWAMRCLLIQTDNRLILVDTGIGTKQNARFFDFYYLHGNDTLIGSLAKAGFSPEEVTDVVHTHLHFDHCGGAVTYHEHLDQLVPTFPKARYWTNKSHWNWATQPNSREKASFLSENILPLQEWNVLHFMEENVSPFPELTFDWVNGHTESQMLPRFTYKEQEYAFVADLLPSSAHLPIPYIMAYDTRPLVSMEEKKVYLDNSLHQQRILLFQHDPLVQACTLKLTEKGIRTDICFKENDFFK
ncbi:MAG: MBL fold metallo-hydrolase [Cytophagaceae bacterium]|jgi:glyoxylase-like metal-dependent hydrolase (beta-lactamase superfamily II)|nr:MBL fold metallo-hydrolase [Cytophagaceae bacterium]